MFVFWAGLVDITWLTCWTMLLQVRMSIHFSFWELLAAENLNAKENAKYYVCDWYEDVEEGNASDQSASWNLSWSVLFPLFLRKQMLRVPKKVRSEEFHMISFSVGCLWWRFMGLYQRLAQGASQWKTYTHFWEACYGQTELKPGLWTFCTVLVLKPGVFLLVYQESKRGCSDQSQLNSQKCWSPACPKIRGASTEGEAHWCR